MSSFRMSAVSAARLALLVGLSAIAFFVFTNSAHAANTIVTKAYLDTNGNGTVDVIRWTMDENVTACAYEAGDWTVNTASEMNLVITGISCTGSDAILNIAVTADANETGATTAPVISYANSGTPGSVTLTSGAMTAKASQTITDGAAPVVVSTSPSNNAAGINTNSDISITFSEAMDTTFAEGGEFTVTPDPGSFSASWASSNTVLTLAAPTLGCGLLYTVDTVPASIDAATGSPTGLVTTGPLTGDFAFRVSDCGTSSSSATPVSVSALTYSGPDCATENSQSFSVTGTNIDQYLISSDAFFAGATWQSQDIEGSGTITATLPDGATNAYLVLMSDDGVVGTTNSFSLTDWSSACASSSDDTTTDDNSNDTTTDDGGAVVPVAGVTPGEVIHSSSSTAVYYVTADYGRRVFINEATYFTWFDSFDVVNEVSIDTLSALPLEGNMLPKAGIVLVKIQSSPVVYFLDDSSEDLVPALREIPDEATAISLFGSAWADYVIDIEPTFFTKFASGSAVSAGEDLGVGVADMKAREDLHE